MEAWQWTTINETLEKSLVLDTSAPAPDKSSLSADQLLVEVITAAINPVDYKLPESGLIANFLISGRPATPGLDFCGRVVATHPSNTTFAEGQLVFGAFGQASKFGTLAQFIVVSCSECAPLPDGVDPDQGAAVGIAATTALQAVLPDVVKPGSSVFVNGGSGGVGTYCIQFAKALGAQVTATCSSGNIELCRQLGADEVLDYKATDVVAELKARGPVFDLAVDNVGSHALYDQSCHFLKAGGTFAHVGIAAISLSIIGTTFIRRLWPGSRRYIFVNMKSKREYYDQIGRWIVQGKVRPVIDEAFEWKDTPRACEKLREGHAKGKIVIHVAKT